MKPEELSIGDWVNILNYHYDGSPYVGQVNGIFKKHGTYYLQFGSALSAEIDMCEPIPITPEILEKNGFFYNKYCEWILGADDESLGKSEIEIHLEESYNNEGFFWKYCGVLINRIYFVHELQHTLRLCKINKNIIV